MEFEKSLFRVHDRLLRGPVKTKRLIGCCETFFLVMIMWNLLNLITFHHLFINRNVELKNQMEETLKPYFYDQYLQLARDQ